MNEINSNEKPKRTTRFYVITIGVPVYIIATYALAKFTSYWVFSWTVLFMLLFPIIEIVKTTVFFQKNKRIVKKIIAVSVIIMLIIFVLLKYKTQIFG